MICLARADGIPVTDRRTFVQTGALVLLGVVSHAHAQRSTPRTIPIVMIGATDPVAAGLVGNLARPGGNVTN